MAGTDLNLQGAGVTSGKKIALRLTFSPSERWCDKRNRDGAETDFLTFWALVWQKEQRWRWDWLSHRLSAGVTKGTQMKLRLTFSPSERWCHKWNTDGAETDFLTFWALEWQMEHWDWLSHLMSASVTNGTQMALDWLSPLMSASVTNGTQMALRLTFSPSELWCEKWNTDGAEVDFLTSLALVWQKEHRWRWLQQLIPLWWPPLSDLSSLAANRRDSFWTLPAALSRPGQWRKTIKKLTPC